MHLDLSKMGIKDRTSLSHDRNCARPPGYEEHDKDSLIDSDQLPTMLSIYIHCALLLLYPDWVSLESKDWER